MLTGVIAGLLLGLAHWRMFVRNIQALQRQPGDRTKVLAGLGSGVRLALTATVGFYLVTRLGVDPAGLGIGMLVSMYGYRVWAWQQAQKGNEPE